MHCAPVQTVLCSGRALQRLLDIQYSVLSTSSLTCWQRSTGCLHLSRNLSHTDFRLQRLYINSTRPEHTTVKATEAQLIQTWQRLQPVPSPASSDSLGRRMRLNRSLVMPTPAASLGRPLFCKFLSSFSATGKPSAGPPHPPRDPSNDPGKNQRQPCQASTSCRQAPLLGLEKPSNGPVAVAISGGVDSAVVAMLLKNAGWASYILCGALIIVCVFYSSYTCYRHSFL